MQVSIPKLGRGVIYTKSRTAKQSNNVCQKKIWAFHLKQNGPKASLLEMELPGCEAEKHLGIPICFELTTPPPHTHWPNWPAVRGYWGSNPKPLEDTRWLALSILMIQHGNSKEHEDGGIKIPPAGSIVTCIPSVEHGPFKLNCSWTKSSSSSLV